MSLSIFKSLGKFKFFSLILFSLVIYINYLANALPIGGVTTGEVSDLLDNLFTPTGFTFSIWGIIYLSLFVFLISLFWISEDKKPFISKVLVLFNINCLLNISWIFAWHSFPWGSGVRRRSRALRVLK